VETKKAELNKLHRTLRQFDVYREELQSQISLTKRVTLKAEDDIAKTEIDKRRQDFYIDQLNEQLRRLREQMSLYEYQLDTQQKESAAAHTTLLDASTEMEAISFEKKQLLNQWKSSLLALQRREDMLRSLESAVEYISNECIFTFIYQN
jgi:chromosome segregation ATPase